MGGEPTPSTHQSGQEVLIVLVVQICEVILSPAVATKRSTIGELLQVVQAAGDFSVAVRVERVEVHTGPADDTGIELRGIQDPFRRTTSGASGIGLRTGRLRSPVLLTDSTRRTERWSLTRKKPGGSAGSTRRR